MSQVRFRRSPEYKETYLEKIINNPVLKRKFASFMDLKRNDPEGVFSKHDKGFVAKGHFPREVPGIRKTHIGNDISIVYKVVGNEVYLYGFYSHDDLGTGDPESQPTQRRMAKKFKSMSFI